MALTDQDSAPARTRRPAVVALVAAAGALALVGCGSDNETKDAATAPASNPTATAPSATTPPSDAGPPVTGPDAVSTTPPGESTGSEPSDAGGVSVQASVLLEAGKVVPSVVKVPADHPIELVVVSTEGVDRRLTVVTGDGTKKTFRVPAITHRTFELPALSKGDHGIYIDGKPRSKLDVGGEPAP